jgi:hypothetical protein
MDPLCAMPWHSAATSAAALRMFGSGSCDLGRVADGELGCWFQHSCPEWDWLPGQAIVIAAGGATIGVGMGQVNRVDAARLAVERGGDRVRGAVAASDAFFPFPDGLETLTGAGVTAIVHPGGSVRDAEVTAAAANAGITLYLTGARHFAH